MLFFQPQGSEGGESDYVSKLFFIDNHFNFDFAKMITNYIFLLIMMHILMY